MPIVIFDTETTGLIPKSTPLNGKNLHKFPYVLQLSWIVYNLNTKQTIENDFIIKCPIPIPEESTKIHGITNKMSKNGYNFSEVFDMFLEDIKNCDEIVAHNINFDLNMLEVECFRLDRFSDVDLLFRKKYYDTMLKSVDILKLEGNFGKYKWPRLNECYNYFFGRDFENQHDALGDIRATLDVYKKLRDIF